MSATAHNRKDYGENVRKPYSFFQVRRNVIFKRVRLNRRNQQPGETAEQYIMICYRLVIAIHDYALSEHFQLDPELTLKNAKKLIRQKEAVHEQQGLKRMIDSNLVTIRPQ